MNARDKYIFILYCCIALFVFNAHAFAQQSATNDAAKATESAIQTSQRIDSLRMKIQETHDKENKLQERIRQIDEEMRPENLEKSTAGIGTTRPEELRDNLRRKLEAEKRTIQEKITILSQSRTNLELSIATTQPALPTTNESSTNSQQKFNNSSKVEEPIAGNSAGKTQIKQRRTPTKRSSVKAKRTKSKKH